MNNRRVSTSSSIDFNDFNDSRSVKEIGIYGRLDQQCEESKSIEEFIEKRFQNKDERLTPSVMRTRRDYLTKRWETFQNNDKEIKADIINVNESERTKLQRHRYFEINYFAKIEDMYLGVLEKANEFIESNSDPASEVLTSRPSTSTSISNRTIRHPLTSLPSSVPKFNGHLLKWLEFRSVFEKKVLYDDNVNPDDKVRFLESAITENAAQYFENLPKEKRKNINLAWNQLIDHYHNEQSLLETALNSAVTMKKMNNESAAELNLLYITIKDIRRVFGYLNRGNYGTDDYIIYFTTRSFDPKTLEDWENKLKNTKNLPTWDELADFIKARLANLNSNVNSENSKTAAPFSTFTSGNKRQRDGAGFLENEPSPKSRPRCVLCTERHLFQDCPNYINASLEHREYLVSQHERCYRCLGTHKANDCRSRGKCSECGHNHHTSLHRNAANSQL